MVEKDKRASRRDVLKLTGTALVAASGISVMGSASADVPCYDCDPGGGGGGGSGGGTGSPPSAPRTGQYLVENGEVELHGWAYDADIEAWFEWGEVGGGFPNDTELRVIDYSGEQFTGNPVGEQSGVTYEYRAVAFNAYGRSVGATRTFSF
ncbi:hypothetical protein SAMN05421858_0313 [Haladaptatus litoreus]|uniref:Uncharacterized protein n=1 Tax=Haladaptatus litoreus TaxID=553468 RepID=A0A1N6VDH0_9EURY|nr:hypothetical protein [Haladaptatus litoreus]SIQ75891.1 hypothetical protein SAMN05421858_0313 [Haladaptatus litoreus]